MEADSNDDHDEYQHEERVSAAGNLMDSKTSHLDDLLNEKLTLAFHEQGSQDLVHEVAKIASEHDPIDLAYAVRRLPYDARPVVYANLPDFNAKLSFMINTGSRTRLAIFREIDDEEIKTLIEVMPSDEGVSILDEISPRRLRRILELLDSEKELRLLELRKHGRYSAGRLMTNEFFAFSMDATIGEVSAQIRDNPGVDLTRRIFVLSDSDELIGFVPARNLIINRYDVPLRQVMQTVHHKVPPEATRDEVVDLVERYKISALPVVDASDRLVGVIAYEDVVEVMEEIADETMATIAGTAEDVSEHEPTFKRFFWRAPWLVVTLCAGLTTATAMSHFRDRPWFIFVPFFVPLIAGMSGNVGIQCSTHMVRSMSTGELSAGAMKAAIFHEIMIGLLTGIVFGIFCGMIVYLFNLLGYHQMGSSGIIVAAIVSTGVLGACITASCLGACSPLAFARLHIDPAVASGPIVTAFNDVFSTLMYFFVAWGVSSFVFH